VLPLGEPAGGVVLSRRGRHDLCPGQIGRAGDLRPFARQVVREVDPLGGDQAGGPLLLLGDLRQSAKLEVRPESRGIAYVINGKTITATLLGF
jgi:hypothetical protein